MRPVVKFKAPHLIEYEAIKACRLRLSQIKQQQVRLAIKADVIRAEIAALVAKGPVR